MRRAIRWNRNPSIIVFVDENPENESGIHDLQDTGMRYSAVRCSQQ